MERGLGAAGAEPPQAPPVQAVTERPLRADARRNIQKVLEAAEIVFASEGLAVPIDTIAARAGVGVGTVYRHFPTKEALFYAVVTAHLEKMVDREHELADRPKPTEALFTFMGEVVTLAAKKRDLQDEMARAGMCEPGFHASIKAQLNRAFALLLADAQAAGGVRSDVGPDDVTSLLMGACLASPGRSEPSPSMVSVIFDGLRARTPAAG